MSKKRGKERDRERKKIKNRSDNSYFLRRKKLRSLIRLYDDPILKESCDNVAEGEEIKKTISLLKSVLNSTETGVGLSAPQIGIKKRVFVICPDGRNGKMEVFINPIIGELLFENVENKTMTEGCLSYPDIFVQISRPEKVSLLYLDEEMHSQTKVFDGMKARIIQHEYDHLSGICRVGEEWKNSNA